MKLVEKLLSRLNGLHYRQEYLCFAKDSLEKPLNVYLVHNGKVLKDITKHHCFIGYSPLIFALPADLSNQQTIHLIFTLQFFHENESFQKKDAIASLTLKRIDHAFRMGIVSFYEGLVGSHQFISSFHQFFVGLSNKLFGKKPGNVFLKGNLYDQVQIAYSVPRKVCLITVGSDDGYNLFPTDLHGGINDEYYVISLRHEGRACRQVEDSGKIVLSDMASDTYKKVYSLGKNHMQPLKEASSFDFSENVSANFQLPLPVNVIAYKELKLEDSFIHGIHKLLLFRINYTEQISSDDLALFHIHNCYATWRNKQGHISNYLMR